MYSKLSRGIPQSGCAFIPCRDCNFGFINSLSMKRNVCFQAEVLDTMLKMRKYSKPGK
jgi:hypothetical protein